MVSGEQRRFSRVRIEGEATLTCGDRHWDARLLDISLRGALISRPQAWEDGVGSGCRLELRLGAGEVLISMEGAIAHAEDDRIGMRCDHIGLESISHLKRLVELNLGDTDLLERELEELASG